MSTKSSWARLVPGARSLALAVLAATATVPGCGDGPICPSDAFVVITAPADGSDVLTDSDDQTPGVQVSVTVRSNLEQDAELTLTVTGDGGSEVYVARAADDGDAVFENVTVPAGAVTLNVVGGSEECGEASDEVAVDVVAGAGCALAIRQEPINNPYYDPLPVLNTHNDSDAETPNFQADVDVSATRGYEVELFVLDVEAAQENSAGTLVADNDGAASFALTLAQGRQAIRAVCVSPNGAAAASLTTTLFVDTIEPTCAITYPTPGQTLIPELDEDEDTEGLQITLEGQANSDSTDVAGEIAVFAIDGPRGTSELPGSELDVDGTSSADAVLAPDASSASYDISFGSQDHAGNGCQVTETYGYESDGCGIVVTAPTGIENEDADGNPENGVQVDVTIQVGDGCVGETVTSDCGDNDPAGVVPEGGELTLRVDLCEGGSCEVTEVCQLAVTSPAGIATAAGANLQFDNLAPTVSLIFSNPPIACNSQITPAQDVSVGTDGVQIDVIVGALGAAVREVVVTPDGGSATTTPAAGNGTARITLEFGDNDVVAAAEDSAGNRAESGACNITLTNLAVSFSAPVADGLIGGPDGTVNGSVITLDLCGTMSSADAAVTLSIDGGSAEVATVAGTSWCLNDSTLSVGLHTLVADADNGVDLGHVELDVTVDLTAPSAIADFAVVASTRQSLEASWTAPSGADSYRIKLSTTALTDGNFDSTGVDLIAAEPGAPGDYELITSNQLRAGTSYWLGVAAHDDAGNRTVAVIDGPLVPRFDATGSIAPPADGGVETVRFGYAMARGRFNADSFDDIAVASPNLGASLGAVYIYLGSADGIGSAPDITISGTDAGGGFGWALTTVRWSSAVYDDLVVGAPFASASSGKIYVFNGGVGLDGASFTTSAADLTIGVNPSGNWFSNGLVGYTLEAADFDGDNTDDLVFAAVAGGAGQGGVAVLFGGTPTGVTVNLSDLTASQMAGAVVELIRAPEADPFEFAWAINNLGPTAGASDDTDDFEVGYVENDSAFVFRGTGVHAVTAGVHERPFNSGVDLKIDSGSADADADFGWSAGSIADQNNDGARDIIIAASREGASNVGKVALVDGNAVGTANIASTANFALAQFSPAGNATLFGAALLDNAASGSPDIDADGAEDLVIAGRSDGIGGEVLFVWYGGAIPLGSTTAASAQHTITAPNSINGSAISAMWAGDVNGDGLEDICVADWNGTMATHDGAFEVLWDDGV